MRTIRVNFKSGVLPRPRQVVPPKLTKLEAETLRKTPQKFEEGMAPRGSSSNPTPKPLKTINEKLSLSAKKPQNAPKKSETAIWKAHIADVRRTYLEQSLKAYEKQEEVKALKRETQQQATNQTNLTLSESDLLTQPSVDEDLLTSFVVKRTPEELEALMLKRKHNRLLTESRVLADQQENLIQLYHQADSFILTLEELEAKVDVEFKPVNTHRATPSLLSPSNLLAQKETELALAELGDYDSKHKNKPALKRIRASE